MATNELRLTDRDLEIIRYVHTYRLLKSRDHLLPLFDGKERALRRAWVLAEHGYLYRFPDRGQNDQDVFALGNKGSDLLADRFGLPRPKVDWVNQNIRLKDSYIDHTLLVADIMTRIEAACRRHPHVRYIPPEEIFDGAPAPTRRRWYGLQRSPSDDPFRIDARIRWDDASIGATIYADWMFGLDLLNRKRKVFFFLEADRGTMPVSTIRIERPSIVKKLLVYYEANRKLKGIDSLSIYEKAFGIRAIRTLFVIAPDASRGTHGGERLKSCLKAGREITAEGQGSRVFLFADQGFLSAEDPLTAGVISGKGEETFLIA